MTISDKTKRNFLETLTLASGTMVILLALTYGDMTHGMPIRPTLITGMFTVVTLFSYIFSHLYR